MRERAVLLCNPAAGARRGGEVVAAFRRSFGADARVLATPLAGDALRAVPDEAVLCIAGGDGTLHLALNALAQARGIDGAWPRLALVPVGSANDGARALAELTGRAHGRDVAAELEAIDAAIVRGDEGRAGDVGRACAATGGSRLFANFAAVGSPADWAALSARRALVALKRASVRTAYELCNLCVIARRRRHVLDVALDGETARTREVFAWFAANARYLGGGLDLGATVRLDSGCQHVLEIAPAPRLELVRRLTATKRGSGATPTAVRSATLQLRAPARVNLDGELWHLTPTQLTIDTLPARAHWL